MEYKIALYMKKTNELMHVKAWGRDSYKSLSDAKDDCYKMCIIYQASEYVVIDAETNEILYNPHAEARKRV